MFARTRLRNFMRFWRRVPSCVLTSGGKYSIAARTNRTPLNSRSRASTMTQSTNPLTCTHARGTMPPPVLPIASGADWRAHHFQYRQRYSEVRRAAAASTCTCLPSAVHEVSGDGDVLPITPATLVRPRRMPPANHVTTEGRLANLRVLCRGQDRPPEPSICHSDETGRA